MESESRLACMLDWETGTPMSTSSLLPVAVLMLTAGASLFGAGIQSVHPGPPIPYEDPGACPFEGCVYREWQATDTVVVRRTRSTDAPIVFRVRKGETVTALTGVVVTISPGRVRFRERVDLSSLSGAVRVEPGDTLYILTYQGEGFTKAWFKGRLYDELDGGMEFFRCDSEPNSCVGTIVERPQRVWWVQVRNAKGQTGWTNQTTSFDGKDALGK